MSTSSLERTPALPFISDYFAYYTTERPDSEAMVLGDVRLSCAELEQRVGACACALRASGIKRGGRGRRRALPAVPY